MVGFSLAEILGRSVDTADERVERMQAAYAAAVTAFLDLRFDDARDLIAQIKGEVDSTELFLEINGYKAEAKDTEGGPT